VAALAGLTLVRLAFPGVTPAAALCGLAALLAGIPLLLLDVGNASPGAIDNASGVGLVLHLAEWLSHSPNWRGKLCLTVLITSAEELALMGAAAYVRTHVSEMRLQARGGGLYVVNLDSIGMAGKLYCAGGRGRLLNLVRQMCNELGIPLGRFRLMGMLFDHLPFARRGFDALSLMTIGRAAWVVHTSQDTVDKLAVEGFRQSGEAVLGVIEALMDPRPASPTSSG
jgi:Zn-dependent M28 family amino/carboxypeptidase